MSEVKERALVPSGGMNGRIPLRQQAWEAIPEYTIDALIEYVEHGRPVASFLYAVLVGDLFGTFRSADDSNRHCIEDILRWLRNVPPASCYGSEAKVKAWVALHQRSVKLRDCPTWQDFIGQWEAVR